MALNVLWECLYSIAFCVGIDIYRRGRYGLFLDLGFARTSERGMSVNNVHAFFVFSRAYAREP